jgi:chromosome segregation ATPase
MVKSLVRIGLLLLVGILIYNFFFGNAAEKAQSRHIFGEVKSLVGSVANLVKSEKGKFDAGKYNGIFDKLDGAFGSLRKNADRLDAKLLADLDQLEKRKAELESDLGSINQGDRELEKMNTPAPAEKRGIAKTDPKAEQAKAQKNTDQIRRKEDLQRELDQLIQDTDKLLQKAME